MNDNPTNQTPGKTKRRYTNAEIAEQLTRSQGNISHAAKNLGLTRTALHDRIRRTPSLLEFVQDARQSMVDAAENALHACVLEKQGWAVCFTLKTLGKSRGYVERQEFREVEKSEFVEELRLGIEQIYGEEQAKPETQ